MSSTMNCHCRAEPALTLAPVHTADLYPVAPSASSGLEKLDPTDFNARLLELETPQECAALFACLIASFGFNAFASGEVDFGDPSRSTVHIINWPARWSDFYRTSGLIDRDPFIEALLFRKVPFTWSEMRADPSFFRTGARVLNLASAAGWREGLVVPVRQASERIGFVSLVGSRSCISLVDRKYLILTATCLHNHVRTLVGRHGFAVAPAGLTPREIEALRLVVKGMSDAAIGRALGIASSTAHEFVEKAKRKMNVRSRAQLAALAVSLAIVNI